MQYRLASNPSDGMILDMRQKLFLVFLCCAVMAFGATDSTSVFQGYSGGMMFHAGYLFGDNPAAVLPDGSSLSSSGLTMGIGGSLRVNLWRYLRVGCEGFVSTMNSGNTSQRTHLQSGSYVRSGCGGVLADFCYRGEHFWPFVGGSVGGGSTHTLAVVDGSESDWHPEALSVLHKDGFVYVNPYVGIDWCMTKRVHMCFRMDWMLALSGGSLLYPTGPRLYVGFMFCH